MRLEYDVKSIAKLLTEPVWLAASTNVFSFPGGDAAAKIIAVETAVESGLDLDYPSLAVGLTDELIISPIDAEIPDLDVLQTGEAFAGKSDFVLSSVYSTDEASLRILVTLKNRKHQSSLLDCRVRRIPFGCQCAGCNHRPFYGVEH